MNSYGLWYKTSQKGLKYAKGKILINGKYYYITLFNNSNKKTEKSPDFNLIIKEV